MYLLSTYCQTLSSQCCFEDLYPKIHLQFILNAEESLEALKTLGRRLPRFLGKLNNIFENWLKKSKNMYISYNIEIQFPTQKFYCWEDLSKLLSAWQILTMKNLHFPLKIFVSSKNFWINEDSSYSSSVLYKKPKNLRIHLRSIFNLRCNTGSLLVESISW